MTGEFIMPKSIEAEAKAYMKVVIDMLESKGILADVDTGALQILARNYSTFIKANKLIEKEGITVRSDRGNISEHPAVKIGKDAQTACIKVMEKFGLTPKDR